MKKTITRALTKSLLLIAVGAMTLLTTACNSTSLIFNYQPEGMLQYRRLDPNISAAPLIKSKKIYKPGEKVNTKRLSTTQANLVSQWGKPDFVRTPFKSIDNHRVQEWAYVDEMRIFQFIDDTLAYEGQFTDYDQVLLRRGRPNFADIQRQEKDVWTAHFNYHNWRGKTLDSFNFRNGNMLQSKEGN